MFKLGSQFMPPLFEGSFLYMPTSLPGIGIAEASQMLQEQDRILRSFPEVATVFGAVGRSDSATDNAPLDMYDTTVMLKPRAQWPAGMTYEKLILEMDGRLQFPGLSITVVSYMSSGALSVALSDRPTAPKTVATSGKERRIRSCSCSIRDASAIPMPGRAVGM